MRAAVGWLGLLLAIACAAALAGSCGDEDECGESCAENPCPSGYQCIVRQGCPDLCVLIQLDAG